MISCMKSSKKPEIVVITEAPEIGIKKAQEIKQNTPIQLSKDLVISLWASDSLAPDPVAMSIDDKGIVYLTRTNRQKHSEFDIRGHRDWMTESQSLTSVEDRRAFLRKTFAPELSAKNSWLKDLNEDGSSDWRDLTVEDEEIWKIEDTNKDGIADKSTRIFKGFNEEITDVAGALLVRENDVFVGVGPDFWRLTDKNKDGILDTKESISHGYAVHIGFGGHGMSGAIEGPDGKIYWNIGDIGANVTDKTGKNHYYPNQGIIARANPDGSNFEVVAHGLRNTHEFVFDEYGNLISSDNDGDHPGESERLVHIVEGSDAGWRSNWQYGKYTDPKNNAYKVWMDEKLYKPRWEGQAAYIIPPIRNYHNGPTGMIYNPGTALGTQYKNKFFLVEFVGSPSGSHIWSFGLKPKGASFDFDSETDVVSGILPTGIKFGIDGALYAADWINGWDTKNFGRIWKIDTKENNLENERKETERLMLLNYSKISDEELSKLLANDDMRIRQKSQFELVKRGPKGLSVLLNTLKSNSNQFARIHSIWGIGQLSEKNIETAANLSPYLADKDEEIIAQVAKIIGDVHYNGTDRELIKLLSHKNDRIKFFAAQALGRTNSVNAVDALLKMIEVNHDEDLYLRHAAVLALSRIGAENQVLKLVDNPSKALRTAAVLVLRNLRSPKITSFLADKDEYIVTEVARAINDDLSITEALPNLANLLTKTEFRSEPLLRRAINANLRVGNEINIDNLIEFAEKADISNALRAEALATLGSWANPSELDRVDGYYRGKIERNADLVTSKISAKMKNFLASTNTEVLISACKLISELKIKSYNVELAEIYKNSANSDVKKSSLEALGNLSYENIEELIKIGLVDKSRIVRTMALSLLPKLSNITSNNLTDLVNPVMEKGSVSEQQQLMKVLGEMPIDNTKVVLDNLLEKMIAEKLSASIKLDLVEAIENTKNEDLISKLGQLKPKSGTETDQFKDALYGGEGRKGLEYINYNSVGQCIRCHSLGSEGGSVGPNLKKIGSVLSREQILQALIEPSARLSPGFGTVMLNLSDGQEVTGVLVSENEHELVLRTSDAEPLKVPISRIKNRENVPSAMPPMGLIMNKREIRDVVEYLSNLK
jgi:quinoprotein glucose dehydrogenase